MLRFLSIKTKLMLVTGITVAGFIFWGGYGYQTLTMAKVHGPYYKRIVQGKDLIADILPPPAYIIESYLVVLQMLGETDKTTLQQLIKRGDALRAEYEQRHAFWTEVLPQGAMKETLVVTSGQLAEEFFATRDREFVPLVLREEREQARKIAHEVLKAKYQAHRNAIEQVVQMATERNSAAEQEVTAAMEKSFWILLVVGVSVIFIVVALSRFIGQEIMKFLHQTVTVLRAVASGDFTQRLEVASQDEVGQMAQALNQTMVSVSAAMAEIAHNSQVLASSSEELTAVSQQMSANAEETSAQAGVVSAAGEQVSKNVQTVAAGAEEMRASIREIAKSASEAARVATQAVQVARTTNSMISQLGTSSQEIGNVIKVITSIAEQTNLLALNATIEAARAGEAGKGFAVVANEVKELAKETAKATEDIIQKIEAIQTDTKGAMQAIAEIGALINQINDISNTIASAVEEQTATTDEMSRNVAEAAKGSSEIARNITGVAQAAQSTASGTTETQAASQELSRLAAALQERMRQFRFDAAPVERRSPVKPALVDVRPHANGHVHEAHI